MVEFGEKLKQIREEKGMTQQTLAEKLYVTRQAVSLAFAVCIVLFFGLKERKLPLIMTWGISLLTFGYLAYVYKIRFMRFTDLGFVVTTVHMVGKMGMTVLLGYQAYVWEKKRKIAYKE